MMDCPSNHHLGLVRKKQAEGTKSLSLIPPSREGSQVCRNGCGRRSGNGRGAPIGPAMGCHRHPMHIFGRACLADYRAIPLPPGYLGFALELFGYLIKKIGDSPRIFIRHGGRRFKDLAVWLTIAMNRLPCLLMPLHLGNGFGDRTGLLGTWRTDGGLWLTRELCINTLGPDFFPAMTQGCVFFGKSAVNFLVDILISTLHLLIGLTDI